MGWVAVLTGAALVLSGCGKGAEGQATDAIQKFLTAVHANDRTAFETMIDREALRGDLRNQLMAVGRAKGLEVDGGASEFVLDRMIAPRAFRLVDAVSGQPLAAAPSADQIAKRVRMSDGDHACYGPTEPEDPCVLSFLKEGKTWKLVGMRADQLTVAVEPPAASK